MAIELQIVQRIRGGRLSRSRLAKIERKYSAFLPDDYREFLFLHNGGVPRNRKFFLDQDSSLPDEDREWSELMCFYSVQGWLRHNEFSVQDAWMIMREDFPDFTSVFPIGQDDYGNLIVIDSGENSNSNVYMLDHEEGERIFLASSFSEFCRGLQYYSDDDG